MISLIFQATRCPKRAVSYVKIENEDETGKVRDEWTTDDTMD